MHLWRISQELNTRVTEERRCVCMCFMVKKNRGLLKSVLKVGDGQGPNPKRPAPLTKYLTRDHKAALTEPLQDHHHPPPHPPSSSHTATCCQSRPRFRKSAPTESHPRAFLFRCHKPNAPTFKQLPSVPAECRLSFSTFATQQREKCVSWSHQRADL